jgi:hypothetical protein
MAAGRCLLAALVLAGAQLAGAQPVQPAVPTNSVQDAALVRALKSGGLVLYIRHTSTDFSQNDAQMKSFEDCASQRNLTDKGRDEARRIGEALRKLRIPLGKVFASPFCRTMETAKLVFGKAERMPEVRGGPVQSDDPKRYDGLRRLLATAPAKGTNNAISSHGNPFYAVTGPPYLQEGEVAVVRPSGAADFEVIARLKREDWDRLTR